MRKIKSLVNQTRQFPEYLNAIDTLNIIIESEKNYIESCNNAYGNEFIKFYSKQPKSLQIPLTEIRAGGTRQIEIFKESNANLVNFKTDFGDLNMINNEIQRKIIATKDSQTTAQKPPEAKTPSDLNSTSPNTSRSHSDKEVTNLKKRFISSLSGSLKKLSESQIKIANDLEEVSKQFSSQVSEIKNYKDPGLARLAQRLEQLDYEIAE
ncbi:hypothetical protein M9Y10_000943 [Tritrichomonas musculus]|uniref:Uncharacterized protein n=1 Tax=Tritrichomonas musculus TaxID=1915356 RepID=A0ABR2L6L3_9EUKA